MRILVVDDDYVNRTKLKTLLAAYGDCDAAPSGDIALEMFKEAHAEGVPYDLITVDIRMPGKEGREVLKEIRDWENENKCYQDGTVAKVLMITVMKDRDSIMSSFRENCDGYLIKPVTPENLREELAKLKLSPPS